MADEDARSSAANGTGPNHAPGLVVLSSLRANGELVLVMRGEAEGQALGELSDALERAVLSGAPRVHVDLSGLRHWSMLAQAMMLTTARRLAQRGSRLVLHRMSADLHDESRALGVAQRIGTVAEGADLAE